MMDDTNLQMSNVISDISENRNGHDKETEIDLFDLFLKLLNWSSFKYLLHFSLFLLFISHLLCQFILFLSLLSLLDRFGDMFSNLFVTIVNDLY